MQYPTVHDHVEGLSSGVRNSTFSIAEIPQYIAVHASRLDV